MACASLTENSETTIRATCHILLSCFLFQIEFPRLLAKREIIANAYVFTHKVLEIQPYIGQISNCKSNKKKWNGQRFYGKIILSPSFRTHFCFLSTKSNIVPSMRAVLCPSQAKKSLTLHFSIRNLMKKNKRIYAKRLHPSPSNANPLIYNTLQINPRK